MNTHTLTEPQKQALVWLLDRGGSASRQKDMTYLAAGEIAPFMTGTWKRLKEMSLVDYGPKQRLILLPNGEEIARCAKTSTKAPRPTDRDLELYGEE